MYNFPYLPANILYNLDESTTGPFLQEGWEDIKCMGDCIVMTHMYYGKS